MEANFFKTMTICLTCIFFGGGGCFKRNCVSILWFMEEIFLCAVIMLILCCNCFCSYLGFFFFLVEFILFLSVSFLSRLKLLFNIFGN
jgi:hypothetical protein